MATLTEVQQHAQTLTDDELVDLRTWITITEQPRREVERASAQAQEELIAEIQQRHPELAPKYATQLDEVATLDQLLEKLPLFVHPTSKASAYPAASLVKHEGRPYRARRMTDNEPGTPFSGWEDVTDELLKPIPVQDGNAEDADTTDAPGLITEPEPEADPAPQVKEWKVGEWYSKGEPARVGDIVYTSLKLHKATDATHPSKGTPEWMKLG